METISQKYTYFLERHKRILLLAIAIITVVFAAFALTTTIDMGMYNLLPERDPIVQSFKETSRNFGGFDSLIITVSGGSNTIQQHSAEKIAEMLGNLPSMIRAVDYRLPVEFFTKRGLLYLEEKDLDTFINAATQTLSSESEQTVLSFLAQLNTGNLMQMKLSSISDNPLVFQNGYYYTPDSSTLLIIARPTNPNHDMVFFKNLIQQVNKDLQPIQTQFPDLTITVSGMPKMMEEQQSYLNDRILLVTILALIGIILLFTFMFHRLSSALLAAIPVIIAIIWTIGINEIVIGQLNLVTSIFSAILLGLGIDFSIHFISHFFLLIDKGYSKSQAVTRVIEKVGRGLTSGALTTTIAFFLLMSSDFKGLSELGFIAGIGIMISFLLTMVLLPIFLLQLNAVKKSSNNGGVEFSSHASTVLLKMKIPILLGFIAILILPFFIDFELQFNYNAFSLLPAIPSVERQEKLIADTGMSFDFSIVAAESISEARKQYEALSDLSIASYIDSPTAYIPTLQTEKIKKIKDLLIVVESKLDNLTLEQFSNDQQSQILDYYQYLKQTVDNGPIGFEDLPAVIQDKYQGSDGSIATFVYGNLNMWEKEQMEVVIQGLKSITNNTSGTPFMWYTIVDYIREDLISSSLLVLIAMIVIVSIDFKRPSRIALVLIPVVTGFGLLLGFISLMGIKFNAANIAAFPIILGIAIDDGIHMIRSFIEEKSTSITPMLQKSGKAVLTTSLTTMIGFGSLYFVGDPLVSGLGVLLFFGSLFSLIASLTLLPIMTHLLRNQVLKA
ncbi:efflux RND transporter permease subunit [Spirochaeta lutea]|uniref:SSD domain-containing protein n=1 Tax=Spirochaeta lutea TaxID=1480694 RepID=A0A098QV72_9SPIO|nr:MMPL family transporter [Spirochaeta lutea]KGE71755.1 hypothetical protein DC28_11000 [Spirochaeta lutea]